MQSLKRAFAYGFLVWLLTLLVSMAIFPLKRSWPVLFDSIMPVALALYAMIFASRYFQRYTAASMREGVWLGALWLVINWLLDWPMFSFGPMKMSIVDYMADIGFTYLMLPIVTIGIAFQAAHVNRLGERESNA